MQDKTTAFPESEDKGEKSCRKSVMHIVIYISTLIPIYLSILNNGSHPLRGKGSWLAEKADKIAEILRTK